MPDILASIKREADRLTERFKQIPAELKMLYEPNSVLAQQVSDILNPARKSSPADQKKLKEDAIGMALDLNPVSGVIGMVGTATKKLTPEILKRLDEIDRSRAFYEIQAVNAIEDSAKLAKALKISDKLKNSPTLETIDNLLAQATKLPVKASNRSKLAVRDLISTYLLPARRRVEYNTLSPDEIMKNLQSRGILSESGQPAENVVRVIRGQKTPYERLRTPVENFKNILNPEDISNQAVFASKNADEASSYAASSIAGRNPVNYPMYAKVDDNIFNSLNANHINRVINKLSNVPNLSTYQVDELANQLDSLHAMQSQDWQKMEVPAIQLAMKDAGFKGFLTDEAGRNSNIGMFDPSGFLSIFSPGKSGISDIQAFLVSAGLGGALAAASSNKDKSTTD